MASTTQDTERTRPLIEALSLTTNGSDSLVGDVEEALFEARRRLTRAGLALHATQVATVRRGLTNWHDSLENFQATEQQIRAAQTQENAVWHTLDGMRQAAGQVSNTPDGHVPMNAEGVEQILAGLTEAVHTLIDYFPEARRQFQPEANPAPQYSNLPDWVNNASFRTDSWTSRSTFSSPPPQDTESNYSRNSANTRQSNTRPWSPWNDQRPDVRPMTRIDRVNSTGNARTLAGRLIQTPEDAANARQDGDLHFGEFNLSGHSVNILGNVYGRNPFATR